MYNAELGRYCRLRDLVCKNKATKPVTDESGKPLVFEGEEATVPLCGKVTEMVEVYYADNDPAGVVIDVIVGEGEERRRLEDFSTSGDTQPCPHCGHEAKVVSSADGGSMAHREHERYPYFCLGTGQYFQNAGQRRDYLKRNNLVEAGNDLEGEVDRWSRRQDDRERKVMAEYRRYLDQCAHDPSLRQTFRQIEAEKGGFIGAKRRR
jgi:hypothetical protein